MFSSQSGSADVLAALKISHDQTAVQVKKSLQDERISFLLAPAFYPVFAKIGPLRKRLGVSTLFNALGPSLNPAPLTHQLMGVYDQKLLPKLAEVLKARGLRKAMVVHGPEGLDELGLNGTSQIASLYRGNIEYFSVSPEAFGLKTAPLTEVRGGSPDENARLLQRIFKGEKGAPRDLVVLNAAMALILMDQENDYQTAARKISEVLDSGATLKLLFKLQERVPA